jgi:PAS domain S-box-containing protein
MPAFNLLNEFTDCNTTMKINFSKNTTLSETSQSESNAIRMPDKLAGGILQLFQSMPGRKIAPFPELSNHTENNNDLYRNLIELSNELVHVLNPSGQILFANTAWKKALGYTDEDIKTLNFVDVLEKGTVNHFHQNMPLIMAGKSLNNISRVFITKDGRKLFVEGNVAPLYVKGKVVGAQSFFRDVSKRKTAEEELKGRESFYRAVIENSTDMKTLVTADGIFVYGSPSITKILGYVQKEYIGHRGIGVVHPEDVAILIGKTQELKKTPGKSAYMQLRILHKRGMYRWCEGTITNLLEDTDVKAFVTNFRDITEEKHAEEELNQSQAQLLASQRIAHIGSWELYLEQVDNVDPNTLMWSDETYRILGFEPGEVEVTNELFFQMVHPDDRILIEAAIKKALDMHTIYSVEHRITRDDGKECIVHERGEVVYDITTGKPIKILGSMQDITERRLADESLQKSEANLRTIFDNADTSYILLDSDLKIVSFNHQADEEFIKQFSKPLVEGETFTQYELVDRKERAIEMFKKVLKGDHIQYEDNFNQPDGTISWYSMRLSPVSDNKKKIIGVLIAITDITPRKIAELEREKITTDLVQRNKDLEQFAYIVSHNLRAPLANIMGFSEAITDLGELDPETKKQVLEGLSHSVHRLDNVILDLNQILQVKRQISEMKEIVKFSVVAEDVKADIHNLIQNENVTIKTDFSAIDEMFSLKSYIQSIFYNLMSNSIKYRMPDVPPVIEITSSKTDKKIILTFNDNGMGIDLVKRRDQVFGLYKRFHTQVEGRGMGLFMVRTQVETLGGKISISSEVNKGTTFTIEFNN